MISILHDFIEGVQERELCVDGVAVQQHGVMLAEYRWSADVPHQLYSLSKSYVSTAIGMAIDAGLLHLTDRPVDFFPELLPNPVPPELEALTLRHLLTMSSGHPRAYLSMEERNSILEPDWLRYFLAQPYVYRPGTAFTYDTGCTYAAGAMLQKATGETVLDYLTPRLFEKFGIRRPMWEECPLGRTLCGSGLYLRTRDILKLGQLYLQKGVWNGERLVSESWIHEATRYQIASHRSGRPTDPTHITELDYGYGYQFWRNSDGTYRGEGKYGQFCFIDEKRDAVVAVTSSENRSNEIIELILNGVTQKLS